MKAILLIGGVLLILDILIAIFDRICKLVGLFYQPIKDLNEHISNFPLLYSSNKSVLYNQHENRFNVGEKEYKTASEYEQYGTKLIQLYEKCPKKFVKISQADIEDAVLLCVCIAKTVSGDLEGNYPSKTSREWAVDEMVDLITRKLNLVYKYEPEIVETKFCYEGETQKDTAERVNNFIHDHMGVMYSWRKVR